MENVRILTIWSAVTRWQSPTLRYERYRGVEATGKW